MDANTFGSDTDRNINNEFSFGHVKICVFSKWQRVGNVRRGSKERDIEMRAQKNKPSRNNFSIKTMFSCMKMDCTKQLLEFIDDGLWPCSHRKRRLCRCRESLTKTNTKTTKEGEENQMVHIKSITFLFRIFFFSFNNFDLVCKFCI